MAGLSLRNGAAPQPGAVAAALLCALHLGAALPAMAATYYVDNTNPACSAAGPGSATTPYCTISSAVSQHPGAGNTIMVVAGTYREQVSVPGSGASGTPFVIQAANPSVAVDGADDFSSAAQWTLVSGDVWLAAGVTWAPRQVFADSTRLAASTAAPTVMPARTFQYVSGTGLYVNAGGGNPAGHGAAVGRRPNGFTLSGRSWVTIRGFNVVHAEDRGIQLTSASNQCEISDNRVTLSFKYGIQLSASNGCLVARNVTADNGGHGIAMTAGSTGCTLEDNESYRNADPQVRVANGLYLYGSPGNLIQRNRWHDNQDSGQHLQTSSNGCTSLQNRSWKNGDHGFDHVGATGTIHVGDVAWGNYKDGFSIEGSSTGTQLYNCIATENGLTTDEFDLWVEDSSIAGFVSDYNLFWNSTAQPPVKYVTTHYPSVADYSAASGQDAQTIQADPRFMDPAAGDFRLLAGSPAIDDANSGVPGFPAADARGLARMDDPATGNAGAGPVLFADRGALEYATAVLALSPPIGAAPLLVTADATGSLGPDGTVASYRFDFGDGAVVGPQPGPTATHIYAAGEWDATVTVTDQSGGTGTATAGLIVTAPSVTPLDRRVAASADDAEESASAKSLITGTALDLVYSGSNQTVGMRWTALTIPPHAIIRTAFVQFTAKDTRTGVTSLTIQGQAADNAAAFSTANGNVSSRPRTAGTASWTPAAWNLGDAGAAQRTPDLSAIVDEITNRPGWASGNALALIVTGSGRRVAQSYDGSPTAAPLLHVEYTPNDPPDARISVQQIASPALTVTADASSSTDPDTAPIQTYRFDFGDGTPPVTTTAPIAIAQHTYAAGGNYTVTLVATDTRGLASTPASASVAVNGAPVARLSLAQTPSPPLTVSADASASTDPDPMPITSYQFEFGDGSPAVTTSAPNAVAQHAYDAPGPYTVRVTATDAGGLASIATATITVDAPPVARITAAQVASPALTVSADASASTDADATPITSYRFDFGDGTAAVITTAPTAITPHTYAAAGVYTITLLATDSGGYVSAPATASVAVNGTPVARLSVTQISSPPLTVNAEASASADPDPWPIASYRFDFGDGSPAVVTMAPAATAQHAYAAAGTYTVSVTATDAGGLSSTAAAAVTLDAPPTSRLRAAQIASPALTARADGSMSADRDATPVARFDTDDGTPVASYRFDFGDGTPALTTTAPAATAQHTYAAGGVYTITLVAIDTGGYASAPATTTLTINGAPTARLSITQPASPPLSVIADASASTDPDPMPIVSYRFDFGDGTAAVTTTAPGATAQHTYATAGTYTVGVTATDTGGLASAPAIASITVHNPPDARLTVTPAASPPYTAIADASASTDADGTPIASYRFDFGDGTPALTTTAPSATAQHTYAGPGAYTVSVTATDAGGFASAPATATIGFQAWDVRVAAGSDDSEESASGKPTGSSDDLELVFDTSVQTVGMRWTGVGIPARAVITAAWIQFAAKESQSEATSLVLRGQAADNPSGFSGSNGNVSSRPRTTAAVSWSPAAWTAGQAGANQRTPDLRDVFQEIVNRPGWASGNALAIIVTGTGHRTAWSCNGDASQAPLLHIEYTITGQDAAPVARLIVTQAASRQLTAGGLASATAVSATDTPPVAAEIEETAFAPHPPAALPGSLSLSSARPNPAAGPVSFRLDLPAPSSVRWGIYDLQGRRVWSEEREFAAGSAELSWRGYESSGSPAGPGLYFARVYADNRVLMRRFVRL